MKRRNDRSRRRYFLLDSNQTSRVRSKKARNYLLSFLYNIFFLRKIGDFFKGSIIFLTSYLGITIFILFAIFSPYFNLKDVNIKRDDPNIDIQKIEEILKPFYGRNLIFLQTSEVKKDLLEAFPQFKDIIFKERWPDSLELEISFSDPQFTLINEFDAQFSVVSTDGIILKESADDRFPIIKVQGYPQSLRIGDRFLSQKTIKKILLAQTEFINTLEFKIQSIKLLPLAQELHITNQNETVFWFDLQYDINKQIEKVVLGSKKMKVYSSKLQHVDLRIPNRIFWRK